MVKFSVKVMEDDRSLTGIILNDSPMLVIEAEPFHEFIQIPPIRTILVDLCLQVRVAHANGSDQGDRGRDSKFVPNKVRIAHGHGLSAASQSLCLGGQEYTGCKETEVENRPGCKGFFHADEQNARRPVKLKIPQKILPHSFSVFGIDSQSLETPEPMFL